MPAATDSLPDGQHCTGRVKWFDATRGFGFLISDDCEGDILIHFSVLKEHGRRSLPEGATVECIAAHQDRGFQARKILSIDLVNGLADAAPGRSMLPASARIARHWPMPRANMSRWRSNGSIA